MCTQARVNLIVVKRGGGGTQSLLSTLGKEEKHLL
jgi:hypothetical protein